MYRRVPIQSNRNHKRLFLGLIAYIVLMAYYINSFWSNDSHVEETKRVIRVLEDSRKTNQVGKRIVVYLVLRLCNQNIRKCRSIFNFAFAKLP